MQEVVSTLKEIVYPGQNAVYNVNEMKEYKISLEKYKSETMDINRDLTRDNISNISNYESKNSSQSHETTSLNIMEVENSSSNSSDRVKKPIDTFNTFNEFITQDEKVRELIDKLTETRYLNALKLLFENPLNKFSPQVLRDSLVALADSESFDFYAKQNMARLELHLRTWVAVLEQI